MSFEDMIRKQLRGTTDEHDLPIPDVVRRRIDATLVELVGDTSAQHDMTLAYDTVHDARQDASAELPSPRRAARTTRRMRRLALAIIFLLLSTSVWIASNPQTVESMKPYLSSVFGWIGDSGVKQHYSALKSGELPILAEVKNNGYILRIHEAFYDGFQVSFTYTLNNERGEIPDEEYVIPDFQLAPSMKQLLGNTHKFDHSSTYQGFRAGVVKYFVQKKLPDSFTLAINVPKFGVQYQDDRPYTVIRGDWSFELPVKNEDHTRIVQWDKPLLAEHEKNSFEVVRLRMSDTTAEWHLRLQIPISMRSDKSRPPLNLQYRIKNEEGKVLYTTGQWSSGRNTDTPPTDDSSYIEDIWLYTPSISSGDTVTVVPVITTLTKVDGKTEHKETPLEGLSIKVPID